MNTTSQARLLDRKEKARRSSLQWLFSDRAGETTVHHISGKRDVGVYSNNKKMITGNSPSHQRNNGDGMGGVLCFDIFFGGILTSTFHGVNIMSFIETADEIYMDRRTAPPSPHPEATYFPY